MLLLVDVEDSRTVVTVARGVIAEEINEIVASATAEVFVPTFTGLPPFPLPTEVAVVVVVAVGVEVAETAKLTTPVLNANADFPSPSRG